MAEVGLPDSSTRPREAVRNPQVDYLKHTRPVLDNVAALCGGRLNNDLDHEIRRVQRYCELLFDSQPIRVGDEVTIAAGFTFTQEGSPGWWGYREALAPGCTGTAAHVDYSLHRGRWEVGFQPDVMWSVSEWSRDHIHRYPKRAGAIFWLPMRVLRKRRDYDGPDELPPYCTLGCKPLRNPSPEAAAS